MIVDSALYVNGVRAEAPIDFATILTTAKKSGAFVWIGLAEPTKEEFQEISSSFKFHSLAVEDAISELQRPKIEDYEGLIFLVAKTVFLGGTNYDISTGELIFFIGESFIVIVRRGQGSPLIAVRSELEKRPEFLAIGPWAVVHAVLDRVIDEYTRIAAQLELAIEQLEINVFGESRKTYSKEIYFLKREIIEYRHSIEPLIIPMQKLTSEISKIVPKELLPFFRDINDHLLRACENANRLDLLLTTVLQADIAHIQLRQNDDVRKLSSWIGLAVIPTMVGAIYGMNFNNMPELRWQYGYFIIMGISGTLMLALYYKLKKSKWL